MNNTNNASRTNNQSVVRRTKNQQRLSRFVFTLNNPTGEEIEKIHEAKVNFLTYGKEHYNEPGATPHLQGCCVIGRQLALSTVKKWPGFTRMHIENMKGTIEQAVAYCHKEDEEPYIMGEMPKPGKRNDIHQVVEKMKEGKTVKQLCNEDDDACVVFVKYHRGLLNLEAQLTPDRVEPPTVIWISGKTGTGKTRCTLEFAERLNLGYWISNESLQWFDGYNGQPIAIFDDYRSSFCKFQFLLRLLDRYPLRVPIKGGFSTWCPKYIFITTP